MDVILKVKELTFNKLKNNEINVIRHGFSKNKKYQRLFGKIDKIILQCEVTKDKIVKQMKSISVIEIDGKKIFEIILI